MLSYCLKCRNNTESINSRVSKTSNDKTMILSKCAICDTKKSKFIKEQEVNGFYQMRLNAIPLNAVSLKKR